MILKYVVTICSKIIQIFHSNSTNCFHADFSCGQMIPRYNLWQRRLEPGAACYIGSVARQLGSVPRKPTITNKLQSATQCSPQELFLLDLMFSL